MKQNRLFRPAAALAAMTLALGCTKTDERIPADFGKNIFAEGTPVSVGLALRIADEVAADGSAIPLMRAPLDVDADAIYNVWAFQFNGTGDDALLVCPPVYIDEDAITAADGSPLAMPLIDSGGAVHRLVFAANVNNRAYDWKMEPGRSTCAELKSHSTDLSVEAPAYGAERKNMVMSGTVVTPVTTGVLVDGDTDYTSDIGPGVAMTRSLACIELNLSVAAAGFKVTSVQMRDVSRTFEFFDALKGISGNYPVKPLVLNYPASTDAVSSGESKVYRWFVPRNARGTEPESASALTKNSYAINNSTCLEIAAVDTDGSTLLYRVYPGADDVSDFNIIPNRKYSLSLNITGNGGPNQVDSRIENYGDVMFEGTSNCYLLNPPREGGRAREFSIPVTQVNRYWKPSFAGYGGMNTDRIAADDNWTVYLLWQDAEGIVRETSAGDYDVSKHITFTKSTGTGGSDWFTVKVPAGATHGNFVAVIRKDDPGDTQILWSWHLWVTDYNPDTKFMTIKGDKFVYKVTGGQVERYAGAMWGYPRHSYNEYTYSGDVTTAHPYARSFMMDRNIGALSNGYPSNGHGRGSFYYQFGRKDPFPGSVPLYKIDGTALASGKAAASTDFPEQYWTSGNANAVSAPASNQIKSAIANPMVFYTADGNWSELNEYSSYLWSDSDPGKRYAGASAADLAAKTGRYGKSVYDPCPEGWKLALDGTWSDFRNGVTVNNAARDLGFSGYALRYWPYIQKDSGYPAEGDIRYFAVGNRNSTSGSTQSTAYYGYYWSGTGYTGSNSYCLSFDSNYVHPRSNYVRAYGLPVRCISDSHGT